MLRMFYNNEVRVLGGPEKDKAPKSHDGLNDGFYVTLTRHKMCASLCAFFLQAVALPSSQCDDFDT